MTDDDRKREFLAKLGELQRGFVARLPARADELERAVTAALDGDANAGKRLAAIVHRLAGSAGSFGLVDLSNAANALDQRLRAGASPAEAEPALRELIALIRASAAGGAR